MREADVFLATGHPDNSPTDLFIPSYGGQLAGLAPNHYPQLCSSAYPADRPNYRWVGWVDTFFYVDGGQPPWKTYCTDLRDASCAPQPGQPHGEVVVTLHEGADNIIVIPLSR